MPDKFVEVSREDYLEFLDYVAFAKWQLDRDVAHMCEPPLETFNDSEGGKMWPESVVAEAKLVDEFHGKPDPRPEDGRPHPWWRADCRIRADWLAAWHAARGPHHERADHDVDPMKLTDAQIENLLRYPKEGACLGNVLWHGDLVDAFPALLEAYRKVRALAAKLAAAQGQLARLREGARGIASDLTMAPELQRQLRALLEESHE